MREISDFGGPSSVAPNPRSWLVWSGSWMRRGRMRRAGEGGTDFTKRSHWGSGSATQAQGLGAGGRATAGRRARFRVEDAILQNEAILKCNWFLMKVMRSNWEASAEADGVIGWGCILQNEPIGECLVLCKSFERPGQRRPVFYETKPIGRAAGERSDSGASQLQLGSEPPATHRVRSTKSRGLRVGQARAPAGGKAVANDLAAEKSLAASLPSPTIGRTIQLQSN